MLKKVKEAKLRSSLSAAQRNPLTYPHFGKYDTLVKYTLIPSIPLSIIAILCANPNTWVLSEIHHFYIELFAVILAAILSFYYIARSYTLDDKFSLFIGIGFLANALIDLLHVVVSYSYMDEFMFLKYFIPQTWFAGRLFLGAMFVIAIAGYPILSRKPSSSTILATRSADTFSSATQRREQDIQPPAQFIQKDKTEQQQQQTFLQEQKRKIPKFYVGYLLALSIVSAYIAISSLFIVFPGSVIDNYPLHRPYEIPPLALFVIALLYFYKNQLYKKSDVFYKGLLSALVIDIFGQIVMSYSTTSFDTAHNTAHILKDAAYFVNIIGLALSSIQYNAKLKEANRNLIEREELIRSQYEKLKESDKMKDEFVNIAAHELRTPIQPILGLSEVIRPKVKAEDLQYVDVIVRNAKRLQRLTEEILDVTKIESQSLKLKKEEFNLNDMIVNCINDITMNSYAKRKSDVKILYKPRDIFIKADKGRISQVIFNLLSNAIKFTNKGSITIITNVEGKDRKKQEEVFVSVKDTGQGLDLNILPKLFSKFTTTSPTPSSQSGTGLGLYISKSIIEAHGGRIWAENNIDEKGGATFVFTLPLSFTNHSTIFQRSS
jgi:signal transduction histidine kinase